MPSQMESYDQFCLKTLALLQDEGKFKKRTCEPLCSLKAQSVIQFHGRPILPPRLTAEQHHTMCNYRQKAVQLEEQRQSQQRNWLIARVQDLLDQTQTKTRGVVGKAPSGKSPTISGYTLVTDSPGLTKDSGCDYLAASFSHTSIVSSNNEVEKERTEEQSEEEDDEDEEDISLDSLLKKSREYVKQERKVMHTAPSDNAPLDTTNSNSTTAVAFSLRHSPVGQTKISNQPLYDPILPQPCSSSPISPEQHILLPVKDFCPSLCAQKRRPRPISTGNIHFSFPIEQTDLIPCSPGRSAEVAVDRDMFFGTGRSSHHRASLGEDYVNNCQSSLWSNNPTMEPSSPNSVICSPNGHLESSQFRRRCHTLDSQLQRGHSEVECIDRRQERVPRFMAGVTWLGPNRRLPATPMNQSYTTECPSTSKPSVTPDPPNAPRKAPEAQTRAEGTERQSQAIEDRQRHVADEHALHISQLLAEQEREQQRLLLEQEHVEKRLSQQLSRRPLSADASGWSHTCPIISPSCPLLSPVHNPSEQSQGHNFGFPNPAISPSVLSPVTTWGPNWTGSKSRSRLSEIMTPQQQRAYSRICAITRGFLTRQLLKTEKIKQLQQTVVDTRAFIHSLQTEAPRHKVSYTSQDFSLQERVRAQLRAALYDIHDIFFQMPLSQRLSLLQQDRELRLERKLRDMEKTKSSKDKVLSAATQRSIDRKKRVGESPAQTRKMQQKPKSPTTSRVSKPSQGQNSPATGRLNRQGSWYKKTPEERVRRGDSLKKQHSLG